jgi:hypothetical protein
MRRVISGLIVGIAAFAVSAQPTPPQPEAPTPTVAERAQLYQRIASLDSTAELAKLARETAAASAVNQREQLTLILERHFELDPAGTVGLAGELFHGTDAFQLGPYYDRLARNDVNAALTALSEIDDPMQARVAGGTVFRALGGDERARELVAASLQGPARQEFRADTLLGVTSTSPSAVLDEALALPDRERRKQAVLTIISKWATQAPSDALAAVERIQDPELEAQLRRMVFSSWRDPATLNAYLEGLDAESRHAAIASGALDRLIQEDPRRAADYAVEVPAENERRMLLMRIASVYAQRDAAAALDWAQTLAMRDPYLVNLVVRSIATEDPVRAFDAATSLEEPARSQAYLAAIGMPREERQFLALVERVRRLPEDQTSTRLLVALVGNWTSRPENVQRTLEWMLGTTLPAEVYERVGANYARSDPSRAAAYVDRVPVAARPAWVMMVTASYAQTDMQTATAFLERFRGDPAFDRAAIVLTQQLAVYDPPAAARLLASVGTRGAEGPTPEITIARQWALRDPIAAMSWALDLPLMTRTMVLQLTAGTLAQQDLSGLESWALRLPAGEKRDAALGAVVRARGAAPPNAALLNAFSDDRLRHGALMSTVLATAQADPAAARRLIDGYITDADRRAQALEVVDSIARGDPGFPRMGTGVPAGMIGTPTPPFIGAVPSGFVPAGVGPPAMMVGPNGQPVMTRSPVTGQLVVPGPVFVPAPQSQPMPPAPSPSPSTTTDLRRE